MESRTADILNRMNDVNRKLNDFKKKYRDIKRARAAAHVINVSTTIREIDNDIEKYDYLSFDLKGELLIAVLDVMKIYYKNRGTQCIAELNALTEELKNQ